MFKNSLQIRIYELVRCDCNLARYCEMPNIHTRVHAIQLAWECFLDKAQKGDKAWRSSPSGKISRLAEVIAKPWQ